MSVLCDANIWLALALSGHVHHPVARGWLDTIDEPASVPFCRSTQQALLRVLTNPAVLAPYGSMPLTNAAAWQVYEAFAADDRIVMRVDEPAGSRPAGRPSPVATSRHPSYGWTRTWRRSH